MPPRRSHTKSKAGCQRCKNRKIKCNEVRPRCGHCFKHGVTCDFQTSGSPAASAQASGISPGTLSGTSSSLYSQKTNTNTTTPRLLPASPAPDSTLVPLYRTPIDIIRTNGNPASSRALELKLLHHYTAFTAETLSESKEQRVTWQRDIPMVAYEAPYLMDAVLAVAALHLRTLNPEDQDVVRACHGYMASALAQYSSLLRNGVNEHNSEALFSTAALIAFQSSASRQFDNEYVIPLSWFHSFQGVKAIVMSSWQWLRNSDRVYAIISGQPALKLDLDPERKSFFAPLLEGMEVQLAEEDESTRLTTRNCYEHAVACLNWAHQRPHRAGILSFAATVSRRFIDLLALQDPRTLAIIACFFAMTRAVDDVWWLQGVARREVSGIFNILPQEWWGRIEWPIKVATHEGPLTEEVWGASWAAKEEFAAGHINTHIDMLAELMNQSVPPLD